jgi:hypothetical protein
LREKLAVAGDASGSAGQREARAIGSLREAADLLSERPDLDGALSAPGRWSATASCLPSRAAGRLGGRRFDPPVVRWRVVARNAHVVCELDR